MDKGITNDKWWFRDRKGFSPCRTLAEFAEMVGVPHKTLVGMIATSKDAPAPAVDRDNSKRRIAYYTLSELQKWWKARNG